MAQPERKFDANDGRIRRVQAADRGELEAHYMRLDPRDALNLFSATAEPRAVRRFVGGIDFGGDIVIAVEDRGALRASACIKPDATGTWAELLLSREEPWVAAEDWSCAISTAVGVARDSAMKWLSVESLGFDPTTRAALTSAGFDLQADEEGTIGELRLQQGRGAA